MKLARTLGVLVASAAMASVSVPAVYAQGEGGGGTSVYGSGSAGATWMRAGIPPRKAGTAEPCPGVSWEIMRMPAAEKGHIELSGPIWNTDGTGMSMAKGEGHPDGSFTLKVTRVDGNGLEGTVTGKRSRDGGSDVSMTGTGCANMPTMHLKPGQTSMKHK